MGDNPKCFIHIGAPKTGTTAIQQFLYDNRIALESKGILYPDVCVRGYGHHDIAFLVSGGYPHWATPQQRPIDDLAKELSETVRGQSADLLLSSENFYLLGQAQALKSFLLETGIMPTWSPVILVYLRRQDEAHESWYNQTVKAQGETGTIEESLARYDELWDYRRQLSLWSGVFGRENMIVRSYSPASRTSRMLISDFLQQLGLRGDDWDLPEMQVNAGETRDILEFQRLVNRLPLTVQEKRRFHKELIELSTRTRGEGLFDESPLLDRERRLAILAHYSRGNQEVAETYLGGEPLFDSEIPAVPKADVEAGLTAEKLTYILGWIVARLRPVD